MTFSHWKRKAVFEPKNEQSTWTRTNQIESSTVIILLQELVFSFRHLVGDSERVLSEVELPFFFSHLMDPLYVISVTLHLFLEISVAFDALQFSQLPCLVCFFFVFIVSSNGLEVLCGRFATFSRIGFTLFNFCFPDLFHNLKGRFSSKTSYYFK